jgi:hypothetical protein
MVRTFLFGRAAGNGTSETDLMMTRDEIRTLFSVYRIWQQETGAPDATERCEVADAVQIVEKRLKPSAPTKYGPDVARFCHPKSPSFVAG